MLAKILPLEMFFNTLMLSFLPLDLCLDSLDHSSRKGHPPVLVPGLAPLAKFSNTVTKPESWTQAPHNGSICGQPLLVSRGVLSSLRISTMALPHKSIL